jgi:hypothetical protein
LPDQQLHQEFAGDAEALSANIRRPSLTELVRSWLKHRAGICRRAIRRLRCQPARSAARKHHFPLRRCAIPDTQHSVAISIVSNVSKNSSRSKAGDCLRASALPNATYARRWRSDLLDEVAGASGFPTQVSGGFASFPPRTIKDFVHSWRFASLDAKLACSLARRAKSQLDQGVPPETSQNCTRGVEPNG